VIEISCSTCGEKAQVQSFLTAAQQPCGRCGRLLLGGSAGPSKGPAWEQGSSGGMRLGVFLGILVAIGGVFAVSQMGLAIPHSVKGAILGALSAVLLAPVIAISSFLSMMLLPFSLEAILGDTIWTRLARANNERSLAPLFLPFLILVGLPMTLGAYGGSRVVSIETPLVIGAGLGAILLGALVGAVAGSMLGSRGQHA
jgi:hypothetical protein